MLRRAIIVGVTLLSSSSAMALCRSKPPVLDFYYDQGSFYGDSATEGYGAKLSFSVSPNVDLYVQGTRSEIGSFDKWNGRIGGRVLLGACD